jgi:hypothetical protein
VLQLVSRPTPCGFTSAYKLVEKDMVAYESMMWIRTHDTWICCEGLDMVHMLLTGYTVCVCQYWMYECCQEGTFLVWS